MLVEVRGGEDLAVEPGGEVGVVVEQRDVVGGDAVAGDGNEAHEDPVADEAGGGDCGFVLPGGGIEVEDGDDEVADGDAREDSVEAHGVRGGRRGSC